MNEWESCKSSFQSDRHGSGNYTFKKCVSLTRFPLLNLERDEQKTESKRIQVEVILFNRQRRERERERIETLPYSTKHQKIKILQFMLNLLIFDFQLLSHSLFLPPRGVHREKERETGFIHIDWFYWFSSFVEITIFYQSQKLDFTLYCIFCFCKSNFIKSRKVSFKSVNR